MTPSDAIASVSAFILLALLLPIADVLKLRRHPWHTIGFLTMALSLGAIAISPGVPGSFIPAANWPCALLLSVTACNAVWLRRRFWQAAKAELEFEEVPHPLRRAVDFQEEIREEIGDHSGAWG